MSNYYYFYTKMLQNAVNAVDVNVMRFTLKTRAVATRETCC